MRAALLRSRGGLALWLGGAALALLIFVRITREFVEGDVAAADGAIQRAVANVRSAKLTVAVVDVTALGSTTLVILFCIVTLIVLLALGDWRAALQLLAASAGAGILVTVTKHSIERIRPDVAQQLVAVSGFSYPSGHSVSSTALYLTIAIIAGRYVQHTRARVALILTVSSIPILVGASRVYLGVHYATDVVSGISLGAAWALLLAGLFEFVRARDKS